MSIRNIFLNFQKYPIIHTFSSYSKHCWILDNKLQTDNHNAVKIDEPSLWTISRSLAVKQ